MTPAKFKYKEISFEFKGEDDEAADEMEEKIKAEVLEKVASGRGERRYALFSCSNNVEHCHLNFLLRARNTDAEDAAKNMAKIAEHQRELAETVYKIHVVLVHNKSLTILLVGQGSKSTPFKAN